MFRLLSAAELDQLAGDVVERNYRRRHHVYYKGDPTTHVYAVKSGLVAYIQEAGGGEACVLQTFSADDVLCVPPAVLDLPHLGSLIAVVDSQIVLIPKHVFDRLWRQSPDLMKEILRQSFEILTRTENAMADMCLKSADARVADFLLNTYGERPDDRTRLAAVHLGLTHDDIAFLLNSSRETVSRVIARLARMKVIATGRRRIVILKPNSLAEIAGG